MQIKDYLSTYTDSNKGRNMSGVLFNTQYELAGQIYVPVALDDWKAFIEKEVELGNMDEINKKTYGKWRAVSQTICVFFVKLFR